MRPFMTSDQMKQYLDSGDITRADLARWLSVTERTICNYCSGYSRVPRSVQRLLSRTSPLDIRRQVDAEAG